MRNALLATGVVLALTAGATAASAGTNYSPGHGTVLDYGLGANFSDDRPLESGYGPAYGAGYGSPYGHGAAYGYSPTYGYGPGNGYGPAYGYGRPFMAANSGFFNPQWPDTRDLGDRTHPAGGTTAASGGTGDAGTAADTHGSGASHGGRR